MLKAGVSEINISPRRGIRLAGYPHSNRFNKGIHDPLYACCLYLDNGVKKIAFVTMDLLYIGKEQANLLRSRFKDTDIMFSASHTHSGPMVVSWYDNAPKADEEYINFLIIQLDTLIKNAYSDLFDAYIGFQSGFCGAEQGVGGNRRIKGGPCDDSVNMIAVKDKQNTIRACLLNYTLHPTYLHAENMLVSADYPGYIRRFFKFARPDAVFLFAQGTAGDQSSRYHRVGQDYDEATRAGTTIAVEGNRCIDSMNFTNELKITSTSKEMDLPFKKFPSTDQAQKEVQKATEKLNESRDRDYITMRNAELALFGAENLLKFAKLNEKGFKSSELPCEIQIITLNDNAIIGVQGEWFVEYGLKIKEISPFKNTYVFAVTNGALPGYVYTPEAASSGGYEVGSSMFSEEAGNVAISEIMQIFKEKLFIIQEYL